MFPSLIRRGALLATAAVLLGACQWGLGFDPGAARKGELVTVTNEGHEPCWVFDEQTEEWNPGETDAVVAVVTSLVDFSNALADAASGGGLDALADVTIVDVVTDEDGIFSVELPAPSIPGDHLVMAHCNASLAALEEMPDLREALVEIQATAGDVDPEALMTFLYLFLLSEDASADILFVEQDPMTVSVDRPQVKAGESVVATFSWCQAENDLDLPAILQAETEAGAEDPEGDEAEDLGEVLDQITELSTDHPDLDVYVDGELVTTVAATERYPTGTVDVPLPLTEVGTHEIEGVCRYQTFELRPELFVDVVGPQLAPQDIEYPFPAEPDEGDEEASPFVWDEAEMVATASVEVVAAATGAGTAAPPAQPVGASPTYTG